MIMITAIIRPFRLEAVRQELIDAGLLGLTVVECVGHGQNPKFVSGLRGGADVAELLPAAKVEIAVPDDSQDAAIDAIVRGARSGNADDGKIFVTKLDRVVTVRTGWNSHDATHLLEGFIVAAE